MRRKRRKKAPAASPFTSGPGCPAQANVSTAEASAVHVGFLALSDSPVGRSWPGGRFLAAALQLVASIEAHSPDTEVFYHVVVDGARKIKTVRKQLCSAFDNITVALAARRGTTRHPKQLAARTSLYSIDAAPAEAKLLHSSLAMTASGPGRSYLWKNLLHLVLPLSVPRLIFLDADLFLYSPISRLWNEFARFAPSHVLGIALEQNVLYRNVTEAGGLGFNTGVMLMALDRMRAAMLRLIREIFAVQQKMGELPPGARSICICSDGSDGCRVNEYSQTVYDQTVAETKPNERGRVWLKGPDTAE